MGQAQPATAAGNQSGGVPMPGSDKPTRRVVALIVLLVCAAASLRGYLPANIRAAHDESADHPAAQVLVIVLLGVSLALIAISVIAQIREQRTAAQGVDSRSQTLGGRGGRPSWRVMVIGLAVILAWLLLLWLLARLPGYQAVDAPASGPGSRTPSSGNMTAPPSPGQEADDSGGGVFGYLLASTVALLVLLVGGAVVVLRRRLVAAKPQRITGDEPERGTGPAGPETLARAAELGLAEIGDFSREPREAIIACYAVMERELAGVPGAVPQDCDTPTEVLVRAVEHRALQADNAAQLVSLFAEARFSPHVMTERHREDAVRTLRVVLAEFPARPGCLPRSIA